MFKSAATKIAHNTTIPALAGNPELRSLQELITAEKAVIVSLQKLSADFSKASEALKTWGLGEGDDLGNILGASTTILTHFTSAISQYASHGHTMREQLKAVRTREENLDELRRRRRNVASKADSAEKKLQKMGPEHKNLMQQTDQLNRLREEIRALDSDIMRDEAAIGDFKRMVTRAWLGLKFGGLLECCEKGMIVGEYGKFIVSEIPEDETQPGLPRAQYFGHAKVEELVAEAHRCANEVRLSTVPAGQSRRVDQQLPQVPGVSEPFVHAHHDSFSSPAAQQPPFELHTDSPRRDFLPEPQSLGLGTGRFLDPTNEPQHQPQYSGSLSSASAFQSSPAFGTTGVRRVDEFGSTQPEGHLNDSSTTSGAGRFATFPVKGRSGSMGATDNIGSGGSGVGGVGGGGGGGGGYPPRSDERNQFSLLSSPPQRQESDSFSSSVAKALAASTDRRPSRDEAPPPLSVTAPATTAAAAGRDGPAPAYESPVENENPWVAPNTTTRLGLVDDRQSPTHARNTSNLSNLSQGEGGLAYMSGEGVDDKHVSRHVRFGEVSQINDSPLSPMTPQDSATPSPMTAGPTMARQQQGQGQAGPSSFGDRGVTRVPVPTVNRDNQDRALDAAAAREIALELHSPPSPAHEPQPQAPAMQRDLSAGAMSPLAPPTASYMSSDRKSVSPHPEYDYDTPGLERAPTYTEHPTISIRQYDPSSQSTTTPSVASPPSQYGTPLSYSSQQPSSQQVSDPYAKRLSSYEQEYNPYEDRSGQPRNPGIGGGGNNGGGGGGGYDNTKPQPSPPFDAQPPNAPYMRSATGARGSNSSLTGSLGGGGGGGGGAAKKISAAAFKRPSPRPGPGVFGPPSPTVNLRGSNNSSPTPHFTPGGGGMADEPRLPSPYGEDDYHHHPHHQPGGVGTHPQSPYGPGYVHGQAPLDYEYDDDGQEAYFAEQQPRAVGANVNANAGGGGWAGIGSGGGGPGPGGRGAGGGQGQQGGYGQGRFATNLEDGLM